MSCRRIRPLALSIVLLAVSACGYDSGEGDPGPGGSWADARAPGGRIDAAGAPVDAASGAPACSNGIDDDCDGRIDFAGGDPGCSSPTDGNERQVGLVCDDGIDNDGDGLTDYIDPACSDVTGDSGCSSPSDSTELGTPGP